MDESVYKARIISGLNEVAPNEWNRLANPPALSFAPFLTWEFLEALEASGAARPETGWSQNALLSAAIQIAVQNDFSSLHINFVEPDFATQMAETGLLIRTDQQFHWSNDGYENFDGFLAALSSAKRKNLRKERA